MLVNKKLPKYYLGIQECSKMLKLFNAAKLEDAYIGSACAMVQS